MSRRPKMEYTCDQCGAVEYVAYASGFAKLPPVWVKVAVESRVTALQEREFCSVNCAVDGAREMALLVSDPSSGDANAPREEGTIADAEE